MGIGSTSAFSMWQRALGRNGGGNRFLPTVEMTGLHAGRMGRGTSGALHPMFLSPYKITALSFRWSAATEKSILYNKTGLLRAC